jgi:hypothetical protein
MTFNASKPIVVVEDGPVGWFVWLQIDAETHQQEKFFGTRSSAQDYAIGLSSGGRYPLDDRSTDLPAVNDVSDCACPVCVARRQDAQAERILVEQLNRGQWHAVSPMPGRSGGVGTWVQAVSDALWLGWAYNLPVESVDMNGDRMWLTFGGPDA